MPLRLMIPHPSDYAVFALLYVSQHPQRDQQGVLRLRLALQAYATARFGRRYVRGELLGMRVRPVGRSTVARANYEP